MINEKLDLSNKRMGEFLVGTIFNIKSGKALNYDKLIKNGSYPYVVRSTKNNGIREFMDYFDKSFLNKGNSISLGVDTSSYFYQKNNFFSGVKIKILYLLNYKLNKNIAMFLISILNKQVSGYGYTGGKPFKEKDFIKEKITLPIKEDGTPDYEWMDQYISQIEKEKEKEINIYLEKNNLQNSTLTEEETLFLKKWRDGSVQMGEFLVGDLFENISGNKDNIQDIIKISDCENKPNGYFDGISATTQNNQIAFYIKPKNLKNVLKSKLTISANGSGTGSIFYQNHSFIIAQDAYAIDLKNSFYNNNQNVLLFIAGEQKKNVDKYSYSLKAGWNRVKKDPLTLPIKEDGKPDYESMEQYILIMKKMAVKKLNQKYNDTISKTEEVVNNH